MVQQCKWLVFLLLFPAFTSASSIYENTDPITDSSDVIYLFFEVANEPIDVSVFLNNVMSGRSTTWGRASKFTRMANSYLSIKDAFEKKDFLKKVEDEIYKHKPKFEKKSLRLGTRFKVSEYDFDNNQYVFSYNSTTSMYSKKFGIEWSFPAKTFIVRPMGEAEAREIEKIAVKNKGRFVPGLMSLSPIKTYKEGSKHIVKADVDLIEIYNRRIRTIESSSSKSILFKFIPSIHSSLTQEYAVSMSR